MTGACHIANRARIFHGPGIGCLALLALGGMAQASQPISTSLTECNVIFSELAVIGEARGKSQDEIAAITRSATVFLDAAFAQAKHEGQPDAYEHVRSDLHRLTDKWDGRFSRITLLNENMEWIKYCRALGKDRGLELP
ncbi:hypothetical protein EI983_17435 [Roseovarius faecimaris]|uniref:Uncharacterized protein n=1 Tax=Roseovarius faecimaris TaxID=2494550 RepID=A0A6I6IV44_9RHOB|nr:hypothetical protein [Roseovarius faecimaris]QGX99954.1 hypothetical protein EI983_17435 [Roseovarius faecimaris]